MVGLKLALALAALKIEILSDSQLVVRQIQREYEARDEHMAHHLNSVESHLDKLVDWRVKRVPYEKNRKVDALVGVVPPYSSLNLLCFQFTSSSCLLLHQNVSMM